MFKAIIHTYKNKFLNILIPRSCAGCGLKNEAFCDECKNQSYKKGAQCLYCGQRNGTGKFCQDCKNSLVEVGLRPNRLNLNRCFWTGRYDDALRNAIMSLKYMGRKELAKEFARMLFRKFCEVYQFDNKRKTSVLKDIAQRGGASIAIRQQADMRVMQNASSFAVVPIPLHFKKEYERGFNQAELLAQEFSKISNIPLLTNLLLKIKETPAQVKVENKDLRIKNLEGAFALNPKQLNHLITAQQINYSTIILIDDVATTGATLFHASRALEPLGAKEIVGLVVAHG